MALEQADLEQIERIVKSSMEASLADHPIKCPLPAKWANSVGHFAGMVEDVGDGDVRRGIEKMRDYFKAIDNYITLRGKVTTWIARSVVGAVLIGIGTLIALGIKAAVGK